MSQTRLQRSCDLVVRLGSAHGGVKAISCAEVDAADLLCFCAVGCDAAAWV